MTTPPGQTIPPPRLYAIVAHEAPVALVFRRGPSDWFHLLRWRLDTGELEPGAWAKKTLYPERCDLSDDGELMLYFIAGGFDGTHKVYAGLSRVPWLRAIESWEELGTWGRGWCFHRRGDAYAAGETLAFKAGRGSVTIHQNAIARCVNQLRRGWSEAPDCPPREARDTWDEHRAIILHKRGAGGAVLRLEGFSWWSGGLADTHTPRFALDLATGQRVDMPGVVWADWDHRGRVLVATADGHLRALDPADGLAELESHDLNGLTPDPAPAPAWAERWPDKKKR